MEGQFYRSVDDLIDLLKARKRRNKTLGNVSKKRQATYEDCGALLLDVNRLFGYYNVPFFIDVAAIDRAVTNGDDISFDQFMIYVPDRPLELGATVDDPAEIEPVLTAGVVRRRKRRSRAKKLAEKKKNLKEKFRFF